MNTHHEKSPTLDAKQLECVQYSVNNNSSLLVIAGAGSGKTEVLTRRVIHMIEQCNVLAQQILCLTFSKKAAFEMRCRLRERTIKTKSSSSSSMEDDDVDDNGDVQMGDNHQYNHDMVHISTIHSFCYQSVMNHMESLPAHVQESVLMTRNQQNGMEQILREILEKDLHFDSSSAKVVRDRIRDVTSYIQRLPYGELLHIMNYEKLNSFVMTSENDRLYRELKAQMRKRELMDFNDLIHICIYLLENDENFRNECRSLHRHILVDEFQDMGPLEFELLKRLICLGDEKSVDRSVSCFGDDDQCIYSFKGTSPKIFDWYRTLCSNCKTYTIDTNYRSSNSIVKVANSLIQSNVERVAKNIRAHGAKPDESVIVQLVEDRKNEGLFLVNKIKQLMSQFSPKLKYRDIAVLCRVNRHLTETKVWLRKYQIPFKEIETNDKTLKPGKDSKQVVDLLAYFVILIYSHPDNMDSINQESISRADEAFRRVVPRYKQKKIDLKYLEDIQSDEGGGISLWDALRFAVENQFPCTKKERSEVEDKKAQLTMHSFAISHSTHASFKKTRTTKLLSLPTQRFLIEFYNTMRGIIKKADSIYTKCSPQDFVCKLIDYICNETPYQEEMKGKLVDQESIKEMKRRAGVALFSVSQRIHWHFWLTKLLKCQEKAGSIVFSSEAEGRDKIAICSVHQAKGLEWKIVFLLGMNTGVLPISENSSEIVEDERRIAFVGMTRAKEKLFLTVWDKDESNTFRSRSRFVSEILREDKNVSICEKQTNNDLELSISHHNQDDIKSSTQFAFTQSEASTQKSDDAIAVSPVSDEDNHETSNNESILIGDYPALKKKKVVAVPKRKLTKIVDESKMTKGQRDSIEKSSNLMSKWLSKSSSESKSDNSSESKFEVHSDAVITPVSPPKELPKRPRVSKENEEPTPKKKRTESSSSKVNAKSDTRKTSSKKTLILKPSKEKAPTQKKEKKTQPPQLSTVSAKSDDELICDQFYRGPVGVQFIIGQCCSHCNQFNSSTYIETTQEATTDMEIACEHCKEMIEAEMKVSYKLPALGNTNKAVEERCCRLSRKAIRTMILTINKCNGETGSIESLWLLENQRDLFWNILYQYGHIQEHITKTLKPSVKASPNPKQKTILELFKRPD